jgi:DNA-binding XRE family transcriptional regulator
MSVKSSQQSEKPPFYFRQWRKFRGLTQQELALKVGLSNRTPPLKAALA